ncbi:hypothetical protein A3K82_00890 [Candidatus Pacearchaeota archaeon RBG_19FT_COMBO_34_9]|nr:MAG: hypothetical protein A3K82_00890 [Candidatus Pacearchaeota archaeon RBG_19FT_COMBO_34_9]OGJ16548.1 MAG: hypothetical protein A3K74_00385 [Candidatus Pacearchaeota archaeon RBG_13_33_26]
MNKRILIFSPELKDREQIEEVVGEYFTKEFRAYFKGIQIQAYPEFKSPQPMLGHLELGEVFVVFDQRICSKEMHYQGIEKTPYFKSLKLSFELSQQLCNEKNIPYVLYKGEIAKKEDNLFIAKIDSVKDKIKNRLEEKILEEEKSTLPSL